MKLLKLSISLVFLIISVQGGISQNNLSNKNVAKRYIEEVVNKQKLDMLDQIFADTFLVHNLTDSTESQKTITNQSDFLKYLFKAFPDIHYTIGDIIEDNDKVAMRVSLTATHKDEFWGYQGLGNQINYLSEIFFCRLENGKIVEIWVQMDLYNLFNQLKGKK